MKTRNIILIIACFVGLAAVITMHDMFKNQNLRIVLSLAVAVAAAYLISRSAIPKQVSARTMTVVLASFFVFTCLYHILLSAALGQSIFANYFWGFLCVIYLLAWLRVRQDQKG